MNSLENKYEDPLRSYMSSDWIEKAPEGFTSRVMGQVLLEKTPAESSQKEWSLNRIPIISAAIIMIFILAAMLLPSSQADPISSVFTDIFKNLNLSMSKVELPDLFTINMPGYIVYILAAILVLSLSDKALNTFFNREK